MSTGLAIFLGALIVVFGGPALLLLIASLAGATVLGASVLDALLHPKRYYHRFRTRGMTQWQRADYWRRVREKRR